MKGVVIIIGTLGCGWGRSRTTCHSNVSIGRPDLVADQAEMNSKLPIEVTLGSHHRALWVCSRNPELSPLHAKVQELIVLLAEE